MALVMLMESGTAENTDRLLRDWETLVPRINVENVMKLGFVLE
jgi:hypothetical protein